MEGVRAGAEKGIEDSAASTAYLGVVGVGLDLNVLNGLDGGNDDRAIVGVRDRNAIDEIEIGGDRSAGDRRLRCAILIGEAHELLVTGVDEDT